MLRFAFVLLCALIMCAAPVAAVDVASITTPNAATYTSGQTVQITVTFTAAVDVILGTSRLHLNAGRTSDDAYADVHSSANGTSIVFYYTVVSGDYVDTLDYTDVGALTGITGYTGSLPTPGATGSLADANAHIYTAPVVTSVTANPSAGSYKTSDTIDITVHLNRSFPVTGSGTPKLKLNLGGTTVSVNSNTLSSPASSLVFHYAVTSGQNASVLDYTSTSALNLSGRKIGQATSVALPTPGSANSLAGTASVKIDTTAPTLTALDPVNTLTNSSPLLWTVIASEAVTGLTKNSFTITTGTANSLSGSQLSVDPGSLLTVTGPSDVFTGSSSIPVTNTTGTPLTFHDGDPIVIGTGSGALVRQIATATDIAIANGANGTLPLKTPTIGVVTHNTSVFTALGVSVKVQLSGTVTDSAGNALATGTNSSATYDPTPPTAIVTGAQHGSSTTDADFTLIFTEPLATTLASSGLTVTGGTISSIVGTNDHTYVVTVGVTDTHIPATVTVNASAVQDATGNGNLQSDAGTFTFDTTPPQLAITASPTSQNGKPVIFTLSCNEKITGLTADDFHVVGATDAALGTNGSSTGYQSSLSVTPHSTLTVAQAYPSAGSPTVSLTSSSGPLSLHANDPLLVGTLIYLVKADVSVNTSTDVALVSPISSPITLGTEVFTAAGTSVSVDLPVGTFQDLSANSSTATTSVTATYDPTPPVAAISIPATASSTVDFTVTFSEALASPFNSSSITATNSAGMTITGTNPFTVKVTPTDATTAVTLQVNAGAVIDAAGNTNLASAVATYAPLQVVSVSSTAVATYKTGQAVSIVVTLNKQATFVHGTNAAQLNLALGSSGALADLSLPAADGTTDTLTFTYNVADGDSSADLDYFNNAALILRNSRLNGLATLTLPAPGGAGSLGATSAVIIDGVAPSIAITNTPTAQKLHPLVFTVAPSETLLNLDLTKFEFTNGTLDQAHSTPASLTVEPTSPLTLGAAVVAGRTKVIAHRTPADQRTFTKGDPLVIADHLYFVSVTVADISAVTDTQITLDRALDALPSGLSIFTATGVDVTVTLPANAVTDLAGNAPAADTIRTVTYDPTPPATQVTAAVASGSSARVFHVTFSEIVAQALSASNTSALTLTNADLSTLVIDGSANPLFTVSVNPVDPAADVTLIVNAGAVQDAAGNANLASNTATAALPKVKKVTVTSPATRYGVDGVITLAITLNQPVSIISNSSIPELKLETGTTDHVATLSAPTDPTDSMALTDTLTFTYTVVAGDNASDLDYVTIDALDLKGWSVGGATVLKLPTPGATGSLSDTSAVVIDTKSLGATLALQGSSNASPLTVIATFDAPIDPTTLSSNDLTATGISATVGAPVVASNKLSASFSLVIDPTVTTATTFTVVIADGVAKDDVGNAIAGVVPLSITYNPTVPTVTIARVLNTQTAQNTHPVAFTVTANKPIFKASDQSDFVASLFTVTGVSSSTLSIPGAAPNTYTLSCEPQSDVVLAQDATTVSIIQVRRRTTGTSDITLAAGTILRLGGQALQLAPGSPTVIHKEAGTSTSLNLTAPVAAFAPESSDVWLSTGQGIAVTLPADKFSDAQGHIGSVSATAAAIYDPTPPAFIITAAKSTSATAANIVDFTLGDTETTFGLQSTGLTITNGTLTNLIPRSGTSAWIAEVTPTTAAPVSLSVNANAAVDAAGNPSLASAAYTFANPASVTKVASDSPSGSYETGDRLRITVTFDRVVSVTGTPQLQLETGTIDRLADYVAGSDSNKLSFDYRIQAGDRAMPLNYTTTAALTLNSGTITDANSTPADLDLPDPTSTGSLAHNANLIVNNVPTGPSRPDGPSDSGGGCGLGTNTAVLLAGLGLFAAVRRGRRAA